MARRRPSQDNNNSSKSENATTNLTLRVSGYKSVLNECVLTIAPLTILAGANSSGKSSIMQPLLLLKQTLDAPYDPGALLLNGPNAKMTSAKQALSTVGKKAVSNSFQIKFDGTTSLELNFALGDRGFDISSMAYREGQDQKQYTINLEMPAMSPGHPQLPEAFQEIFNDKKSKRNFKLPVGVQFKIVRERCFLAYEVQLDKSRHTAFRVGPSAELHYFLNNLMHLPGLRGNPERNYPTTAVGDTFPGTFDAYAASIIFKWQREKETTKLELVGEILEKLGLTWKVKAEPINDTQVELHVARLQGRTKSKIDDFVNLADVGFGVSQVLPVAVAIAAAKKGQTIYLEQPEIHLHPRAQIALAEILAEASVRGIRIILETHSSALLLAIQTLVAENTLKAESVALHWFCRDKKGFTEVQNGSLNNDGAFGDWPVDFGDLALDADSRYLLAVAKRHSKKVRP